MVEERTGMGTMEKEYIVNAVYMVHKARRLLLKGKGEDFEAVCTLEDIVLLNERGIQPVLHNGKITDWELEVTNE